MVPASPQGESKLTNTTLPYLAVYVVWHPNFQVGAEIAEEIRQHFRSGTFENVAGSAGVSVVYRSTRKFDSKTAGAVDFNEASATAVVVLVDSNLAGDTTWVEYIYGLKHQADNGGFATALIPVSIESDALSKLKLSSQAIRWDVWANSSNSRRKRLVGELTHAFCLMLRHYLENMANPMNPEKEIERFHTKIQVFLSHSKHDEDGKQIAEAIRNRIHELHNLASFFDVYNIPAGVDFDSVLIHHVRTSAVIAVHTDSFSSRTWCRREVIEAKLRNRPLVVANSIRDVDERSFPYLGNVPTVRIDRVENERIDFLISQLLDEVLKDLLWQCRIVVHSSKADSNVVFLPRTPELVSLAGLPMQEGKAGQVIVYPDPPIGSEEKILFDMAVPQVRLVNFMKWTAETFE